MKRLAELKSDVSAMSDASDEMFDIPANAIVEILNEYTDHGFWSDYNVMDLETPFPAYAFRYDGIKYCSVHIKCFNIID